VTKDIVEVIKGVSFKFVYHWGKENLVEIVMRKEIF